MNDQPPAEMRFAEIGATTPPEGYVTVIVSEADVIRASLAPTPFFLSVDELEELIMRGWRNFLEDLNTKDFLQ